MTRPARAAGLPLFLLMSGAVAGCGGGTGSVSGTVTSKSKGKPVGTGNVAALAADGVVYAGRLNPDGTYRIESVPPGPATLTVASPNPAGGGGRAGPGKGGRPATGPNGEPLVPLRGPDGKKFEAPARAGGPGADPEAAKNWFPIPDKYSDPAQSGFKLEVKAGANPFDLVLD